MNLIVCYSGGFQPFGPHHFKSYNWLVKIFGKDSVFICTSDHVTPNRPLDFQEKSTCIEAYNIDKNNIIKVQNPYRASELISRFNPNTTTVIYAVGEKDNNRFQINDDSYFQEYYGQKKLNPVISNAYIIEIPHISVKYNNHEISGTFLRNTLPLCTKNQFSQIMGYYDEKIHFLFKKKFHSDIIDVFESFTSISEGNTITKTQLQRIEQYADQLFKHFNIDINFQDLSKTTHFWQRINDPRNITPITTEELRQLFKKASQKYGQQLSKVQSGYEAILKDMETDINLPFMIVFDKQNNELDLIPKTIMRKPNFTDKQKPFLKMESYSKHIKHIYEEQGFNDFVRVLLQDTNEIEYCTLKIDGYNLKLTFKDNQFKVARNKTEILNPLLFQELLTKYQSKPTNQYVFKTAMSDLGNSLKQRFNLQTLNQIFQNGRNYLNFEIYHPKILNIYDYGKEPFLSIHSLISYDTSGNEIYQHTNLEDFGNLGKGLIYNIKITPKFQLQPHPNPNQVIQQLNQITDIKEKVLYLENEVIKNLINQNEFDFNLSHINKIVNIAKQLSKNDLTSILKKIEQFGGFNPIEGLVFKYKGSIYKCTGTFGLAVPIFQVYNKNRFN